MNKKIIVLSDHLDDIVIAKRYADITKSLVNHVFREEGDKEITIDVMVCYRDHDSGKLELEERELSYNRGICEWCEKK